MSLKALAAAVLATLALTLPGAAFAAGWSYTDGSGNTVTLDHVPTRIIAHANAAAGLIPLGIRPIGIYVDSPVAEDKSLAGLDLTGIAIVGEAWGEIDLEKVAALKPDLIISEWWPIDRAWSGFELAANDISKKALELAPVTGVAQGKSVVTMIEDYEKLAASLGADLTSGTAAADKARFETSLAAFRAAVAAKPNLDVAAIWAGADGLYIAIPAGASELSDFVSWGLKVITPDTPDASGYWEILSWENADKYQPDLVIVDNRQAAVLERAEAQPMWTSIKAVAAGAVAEWPAFWLRNYAAYANELDKLTVAIDAADQDLSQN